MPLHRRLPKRGFTNIFRREFAIVNLEQLTRFDAGATVTPAVLKEAGIIKKATIPVKILGDGELVHALTISAHKFSASAKEKILKAGGQVQVLSNSGKDKAE